jgi:hypothetical protein
MEGRDECESPHLSFSEGLKFALECHHRLDGLVSCLEGLEYRSRIVRGGQVHAGFGGRHQNRGVFEVSLHRSNRVAVFNDPATPEARRFRMMRRNRLDPHASQSTAV